MRDEDFVYPSGKHYDAMIHHTNRPLLKDLPFYLKHAKSHNCKKILELGCGTGRITIPLKEAGFDVVGIDLMELMLKEARNKSLLKHLNIPFIEEDVRDFDLIQDSGTFDLILGPAALFQALLTNQDFRDMLDCVKKHLKDQGTFIFHMFNPNLHILTSDPDKVVKRWEYPDPEGDGTVNVFEKISYNAQNQISTTKIYYKIKNKIKHKRILQLKMYFPCELDTLLEYNGFKIEYKFADFDETPFHSDTNMQLVLCKKLLRSHQTKE